MTIDNNTKHKHVEKKVQKDEIQFTDNENVAPDAIRIQSRCCRRERDNDRLDDDDNRLDDDDRLDDNDRLDDDDSSSSSKATSLC